MYAEKHRGDYFANSKPKIFQYILIHFLKITFLKLISNLRTEDLAALEERTKYVQAYWIFVYISQEELNEISIDNGKLQFFSFL